MYVEKNEREREREREREDEEEEKREVLSFHHTHVCLMDITKVTCTKQEERKKHLSHLLKSPTLWPL